MEAYLAGMLIDWRVPSEGGTVTWAHVTRTDDGQLRLTMNIGGADPRFNFGTGEPAPVEGRGEELIGTFTRDELRRFVEVLEMDTEGHLVSLLRLAIDQAIDVERSQ